VSRLWRSVRERTCLRKQGEIPEKYFRLVWVFASMGRSRVLSRLVLCGVLALLTTFVVAVGTEFQQDFARPRRFTSAVEIEHGGKPLLLSFHRDWGWGYENRTTLIGEESIFGGFRASWHGVAQAMQYNAPNPPERIWGFQPYPPIPEAKGDRPFYNDSGYFESARGWPALSFWSYWHSNNLKITQGGSIDITALATAIGRTTPPKPQGYWGASYYPIWSGLAINLVFYGAIWAIPLFGFALVRSFRRMWRGGCPKCGYDLKYDLQSGCPECGWGMPAEGVAVERE
jgi:hypothetical protein